MGDPGSNQVVIVTGASEGIGKAITLAMLQSGRKVHAVSRNQKKLDTLLDQYHEHFDGMRVHVADVTDPIQVNHLIQEILTQEKGIDILVNNVGQGLKRELVETTDEEWDRLVRINLSSVFYACRAVLPIMRKRQLGWVINIASRAGRRGEGQFAAYCALKHGLVGMTRALGDSESPHNIRINALCPGPVSTERMRERHPGQNFTQWVSPEDVAQSVLFLLSPAAAGMNGQCLDLYQESE